MQSVVDKVSSVLPDSFASSAPSGLSESQKKANVEEALKGEINAPNVPEDEVYEGSNTGLSAVSARTSLEQGVHGNPGGGNSLSSAEDSTDEHAADGEPTSIARGPETAIYSQSAPTAIEQGVRGAPGGGNSLPDDDENGTAQDNLNGDVMPVNSTE